MNDREVIRDCRGALKHVLLDPTAPATTQDRLASLQASLDSVASGVAAGYPPDIALRRLAAQSMAWLVALEERERERGQQELRV